MDDGRYQSGASGFFFEVASPEEAQALKAALATPQSAYAKLAAAKDEVIAAGRAAHDSTTCLRPGCTIRHTPRPRHLDELWRVLDALAAAEAEAGVGADG